MMCNSCWGEIKDSQPKVICESCNKTIHKGCAINDGGIFCDVCYTTNMSVKKENVIDFEVPSVIRRSYIQLYKDCPHQFYQQVIKGVEVDMGIHAQVGIDFHDLAEVASIGEITSPKELLYNYKETFDQYEDAMFERSLILYKDMDVQTLKDKLWQQVVTSADNLFEVLSELPSTPYKLEEKLELSVGEGLPKISITMDRIDLVDGELEITDWKTGTVMVGKRLSSDLQVPLYIAAIKNQYGIPVRKFTLRYLSENKHRVFERTDHHDEYVCQVGKKIYKINITDAIKEVQGIFSQILKGNFNIPIDTKKMYFTCKVCGIKAKRMCEGADMQVWRQFN